MSKRSSASTTTANVLTNRDQKNEVVQSLEEERRQPGTCNSRRRGVCPCKEEEEEKEHYGMIMCQN